MSRSTAVGVPSVTFQVSGSRPTTPPLAGCGKTRLLRPGQEDSSATMRVTLPQEVRMRGDDRQQGAMYSYISPDARVGRPSIAPEQLLRAQLLQILYTIRSERQLMEQLDYNLLFRWFVGLNMDEPVWDPTVFTKNRQRR